MLLFVGRRKRESNDSVESASSVDQCLGGGRDPFSCADGARQLLG